MKMPTQEGKLHLRKSKKEIFSQQTQKKVTTQTEKITSIITGSNNHYALISLIINGLKSPIKRHRLTDQKALEQKEAI